jgi:hypothetical protein
VAVIDRNPLLLGVKRRRGFSWTGTGSSSESRGYYIDGCIGLELSSFPDDFIAFGPLRAPRSIGFERRELFPYDSTRCDAENRGIHGQSYAGGWHRERKEDQRSLCQSHPSEKQSTWFHASREQPSSRESTLFLITHTRGGSADNYCCEIAVKDVCS